MPSSSPVVAGGGRNRPSGRISAFGHDRPIRARPDTTVMSTTVTQLHDRVERSGDWRWGLSLRRGVRGAAPPRANVYQSQLAWQPRRIVRADILPAAHLDPDEVVGALDE